MRIIDMTADPRRAQFQRFRSFRNPMVGVTVNCDITHLRQTVLENGWPFFLTLLYCTIRAANSVPELRRRIKGDEVVEYENCISSHTLALPDGTYTYCDIDCSMPFAQYLPYAKSQVELSMNRKGLDDGDEPERLYFVSSLPWVSFAGLTLPVAEPPESNPAITFGKFFEQDGKILIPVNLTVHHALADGVHMASFFEALKKNLAEI